MSTIAGQKPALIWATHISVALLVILWLIPTAGLLVSSFRDRDQISQGGWWQAAASVEQVERLRPDLGEPVQEAGRYVYEGQLFDGNAPALTGFGGTGRAPTGTPMGATEGLSRDRTLSVTADGHWRITAPEPLSRPVSIYVGSERPPRFTLDNYRAILFANGMDRAFINTLTVTIPATVIPILIAAFAAYALAWMEFPLRGVLIAAIVGLLVVPLQIALVPMLKLHQQIGVGQSFLGIWMAHTGFGLPLAVYLLRNYMVGLPRDIIEGARVDGATDFQIFTRIILPLSFPALASFAIFQFLWTWNDLLVAKVFLPSADETKVMTVKIADDLLGSRGGDWGILAAAAFVSIAVPLLVFFSMQRYLVRGLLAGSVK